MKRKGLAMVLTVMLVATGCSNAGGTTGTETAAQTTVPETEETKTIETAETTEIAEAKTPDIEATEPKTEQLLPATETTAQAEEAIRFPAGSWIVENIDTSTYYFFDEEEMTGSKINQETEMGVAFTYEMSGNQAVFYMGAVDNPVKATIEIKDKEHYIILWEDGEPEELHWLSDENEEEFLYGAESE